jgi:hypothetical protein
MKRTWAKFAGHCTRCNEDILSGDAIIGRNGAVTHASCIAKEKELPTHEAQDELERAFLRGEFYPDPVIG